jgi:hypothetical protein
MMPPVGPGRTGITVTLRMAHWQPAVAPAVARIVEVNLKQQESKDIVHVVGCEWLSRTEFPSQDQESRRA